MTSQPTTVTPVPDSSILLLSVVQTLWRKPWDSLSGRTISQGQYRERRRRRGVLPFLVFFQALAGQLIRLAYGGSGGSMAKYAGRLAVFGYKVHMVLRGQSDLPVFLLVTPAHPHDSQMVWFVVLVATLLFRFSVAVIALPLLAQ